MHDIYNRATGTVLEPCEEPSDHTAILALPMSRREWLKGSGVLMGTLAIGGPLTALAPSRVWAVELQKLTQSEGEALLTMGRALYPHEKLPDAVYALLVKDLDTAAGAKPETAQMLREGVAALDKAAGGSFVKTDPAGQAQAVKTLEGTPFFKTVRGQCITSLYDNDMAWKVFGYPGPSWEKGGYIKRGFQDLKWLPDPDAAASPKAYAG